MSGFGEIDGCNFSGAVPGERFRADVQVAALAGHSLVERSVSWLTGLDDIAVEQDCRDHMIRQLSQAMGVPFEIGDRAFELCKLNRRYNKKSETEDLHGEA